MTVQDFANDNARTLQSYQDKTQAYIEGTPPIDDEVKKWLDTALKLIPQEGKILEVGSGFGRDAEYIQQKGFAVECSDAVPHFVELLQQKGFDARLLNILTDDLGTGYDMVHANGVLLHFAPEESATIAEKVWTALNDDGIFTLNMKRGNGPQWSNEKLDAPRYFYYWQPDELQKLLSECGFEWLSMTEGHTTHNNANWMRIIVRKK